MKQVLFIFITEEETHYALIPKDELYDDEGCPIDLEEINGQNVVNAYCPRHSKNIIITLFNRTGLTGKDGKTDLKQYLNPKLPFTIDEICWIRWSI